MRVLFSYGPAASSGSKYAAVACMCRERAAVFRSCSCAVRQPRVLSPLYLGVTLVGCAAAARPAVW